MWPHLPWSWDSGLLKISYWERLEALTFPLESELHELLMYIFKVLCLVRALSPVLPDPLQLK